LRDKDLDLAFIRPKIKPSNPVSFIDLTKSSSALSLVQVLALYRLNGAAGRSCAGAIERISAVIKKPRTLYIPETTMTATTPGAPAFALDGNVLGIFVTRAISAKGATSRNYRNTVTPVILPAEDILKAARQAIERAGDLLRQGDRAAALAVPRTPPEPDGMRDRAPWEAVLAGAMAKDNPELTALEQVKAAQDAATDSRYLLTLAEAFWWKFTVPRIDQAVRERIGERAFARYLNDPERPALLQTLRAHEIGGRRIEDSLDAITGRTLDGARSIAAVLHGRLDKEPAPARGQTRTWAERAPRDAPDQALEAARMLDARQAELGRQLAAQSPEWALRAWGVPPARAGALREDWERRAAVVESYREAAGITDPAQAIGPVPAGQAQLREAFHASVLALELPGDQALLRAMGRGQLEAQVSAYERAEALAPRDVSAELATADRRCKSDIARAQAAREAGRDAEAETAEILAGMTAEKLAGLRVADAARREWAEAHATEAAQARAAEAELRRRDQAERAVRAAQAAREHQLRREREAEFRARLPQIVAEAEARYAAEAGKAEPEAVWQQPESQAQAEATPEPSWEPGEAMADMDFEAEI